MKKIKLKMGITSAVITAVVLICVIVFNAIISVVTDKLPLKIDLTRDKVYEFSQQTKEVMKNLEDDVTAYALIPESAQSEYIDYIKEYLDKYKALGKHFSVKYVDPYKDPAFMQKYNDGESQAGAGSVIIEYGDKFKVVTFDQLYQENSYTGAVQIDMEKKVTNAVMSVTGKLNSAKIYYLSGHSEYYPQNLAKLLSDEGYSGEELNMAVNGIPEDADVLVCAAPSADFTEDEITALSDFSKRGGRFVLYAAPGMQKLTRLDEYLGEWGISLNYDYVIETDENHALASGSGVPVPAPSVMEHAITQKIKDADSPIVMPSSMSISKIKSANSAVVTSLLETTDKSYGKVDLSSTSIDKAENDKEGPLSLAVISEASETNSAVVCIGSLACVETNGVLSEGAYLNGDFTLNMVSYLAGSNQDSGIRAKQVSAETMTMTQSQVVWAMILLQYVLPALIILAGLIVWLKRRYK